MNNFEPTELTIDDIDKIFKHLKSSEIRQIQCMSCGEKHIPNYGHGFGECDECYFSRFPKEDTEKFYRSFFE